MSTRPSLAVSHDEAFVPKTVASNASISVSPMRATTLDPHWMRPLAASNRMKTSPRKRERTDSLSQHLAPSMSQRQKAQGLCEEEKLHQGSLHEASLGNAHKTQRNKTIGTKIISAKEKSNPRRWTKQEDEALRLAVERSGERNWKTIADQVPGRNHTQCLQRWTKVLKPGLIKGHWTIEEDNKLKGLVANVIRNWGHVASMIPGRTSKQCRERWCNHLDPSINKGSYSEEEDRIILEMQAKLGNRWSVIAQHLKGRTEDAVKIRWKSLKRGHLSSYKEYRDKQDDGSSKESSTFAQSEVSIGMITSNRIPPVIFPKRIEGFSSAAHIQSSNILGQPFRSRDAGKAIPVSSYPAQMNNMITFVGESESSEASPGQNCINNGVRVSSRSAYYPNAPTQLVTTNHHPLDTPPYWHRSLAIEMPTTSASSNTFPEQFTPISVYPAGKHQGQVFMDSNRVVRKSPSRDEWGSSSTPRNVYPPYSASHARANDLLHQQRLRLIVQERDKAALVFSSALSPGQALLTKELEANKERQKEQQALMHQGWRNAAQLMMLLNHDSAMTEDSSVSYEGLMEKVRLSELEPSADDFLESNDVDDADESSRAKASAKS
uniref:Myblike DNAbinding protein putative n=1 Tax=Albugo laibachii Nc14 TaxID=890382 RepID=F0W430_9STRA|nr:myblike DNAbinding protein putative [Albugo laibachii Nc14]|eukprot:CCA15827.1 myblike DNAbinding protein putative [Albugo laibachii Nc14]